MRFPRSPRSLLRLCAAATFLAALPAAARAATYTSYSDPATFGAASTDDVSYAIPAPAKGTSQNVGTSYQIAPLSFSVAGTNELDLSNDGLYGPGQTYLSEVPGGFALSDTLTITLTGATALSFELGTMDAPALVSVTVNGTSVGSFTTPGASPAHSFYGLTATVPMTTLTFTVPGVAGGEADILDFEVGDAVPEPSAGVLLAGGAALLAACRGRRARPA